MKIIIFGDSTLQFNDASTYPQVGWPQALPLFFGDVSILNLAKNGCSTKSFIDLGYFDAGINLVQKGDYVIIEFGHNDEKVDNPMRYSAPFGAYTDNLRMFVKEIIKKGAFPLLLSPIYRRRFDFSGRIIEGCHGDYPFAVKSLAENENVTFIDMTLLSKNLLQNLGLEGSKKVFMNFDSGVYPTYPFGLSDDSHLRFDGAYLISRLFVKAIIDIGHPLSHYVLTDVRKELEMKTIVVDPLGEIKTIEAAFRLVSPDGGHIFIKNGIYREKVKLVANDVTIEGESTDGVIIVNGDYALKIHADGKEFNTFRTYTMMLLGNNISVSHLTVINDAGEGKNVGQAVALHCLGNHINLSDMKVIGHQDTLFLGPLPRDLISRYDGFLAASERIYPAQHEMYLKRVYIEGTVDYVFGSAKATFETCTFKSLGRGFVFAPSTEEDDDGGFAVFGGRFIADSFDEQTFIARPWRDYAKLTLHDCIYQNHINDLGFDKWDDSMRDKTCRFKEINCQYEDKHEFKRVSFLK